MMGWLSKLFLGVMNVWCSMPHSTTDTVKSYIVDNGVDVLDIKRLSQEEWDTQTFYISVRYDDLSKVSDADCWPEHIGYRRYYKKRRTINDNGGTTQ